MSDITYRFIASGQESVLRAFSSIDQAARRSQESVRRYHTEEQKAEEKARKARERGERERASEEARKAKEHERAMAREAKLRERREREEKRSADRIAAENAKAAQRETRRQERNQEYLSRVRERSLANARRVDERSEAARAKAEQRASRERATALANESKMRDRLKALDTRREEAHQQRLTRLRQAEADREHQHNHRLVQIARTSNRQIAQIKEDAAAKDKKLRDQFANKGKTNVYDKANTFLRGAGSLGFGIGAAVAGTGAALGGAAISESMDLQKMANRISINARKHGEGFIDPNELRKQFEAASIATNGAVSAEAIAAGTQKFISKTGDIKGARRFMSTFATTSAATGTEFEHIASAAAELSKKFDIKTPEQMQEALAAISFGGKEGAFEISDAAQKYAKLASAGATFGLDKGVGGVRVLQGLSQIAMDSTGDRDVATTGVEAMFRQIISESGNIQKKLGIDVFTDASKTKAKDITKLLPDIIAASEGDMTILQDIFKDEGKRGINPLIDTFNRAYQGATGKNGKKATVDERIAAGRAAVVGQMSAAINAPGTFADLQMDASRAGADPGTKIAATWERLTATMAEKALPVIERMVDRFEVSEEAISAFTDIFEALLEVIAVAAKSFGIIKDPNEDPALRKRKEQKKLKDIDTELAGMPTLEKIAALGAQGKTAEAQAMMEQFKNPETRARIAQLEAQRAVAQQNIAGVDAAEAARSKRQLGISTQGDFVAEYLKLGGKPTGGKDEAMAREIAKSIADFGKGSSYADPSSRLVDPNETKEQRQMREDFAQTIADKRVKGGVADDAGAVNEKAATGLAAALERIKKASDGAAKSLEKVQANTAPDISRG